MALDKDSFKNGFVALMTDMRTRVEVSDDEFAQRLSDLLEAFVKSGDGIYQLGSLEQSGTTGIIAVNSTIVKIQ